MSDAADVIAEKLSRKVQARIQASGEAILKLHEQAAEHAVAWLSYLRGSQATGVANQLLDGLHAALIETAGCLVLGLVRPAVFSLRGQVDVLLAWLFFKNHPVEWGHVESTGKRYRLANEVLKYLKLYNCRFEDRLKLLRKHRTAGEEDPYALLSAHVHGQNSKTIPPLGTIHDLVQGENRCSECVQLQREIAEYLSDVLLALYVDQWQDLPVAVKTAAQNRLGAPLLKALCKA